VLFVRLGLLTVAGLGLFVSSVRGRQRQGGDPGQHGGDAEQAGNQP